MVHPENKKGPLFSEPSFVPSLPVSAKHRQSKDIAFSYSEYYLLVNSGYASMPHSARSTPSYSSSSVTRIPKRRLLMHPLAGRQLLRHR